MKLKQLGSNMTLVQTANYDVLVSYETPVACYDKVNFEYLRTDKKWSVTTSKHINKWLGNVKADTRPQEFFDGLL